jgi:MFS family permease
MIPVLVDDKVTAAGFSSADVTEVNFLGPTAECRFQSRPGRQSFHHLEPGLLELDPRRAYVIAKSWYSRKFPWVPRRAQRILSLVRVHPMSEWYPRRATRWHGGLGSRKAGDSPGRLFYGWWVLVGCTLYMICTGPGHSYGVSAFNEHFVADLHMGRVQLSFLWLLASFCSASLTPCAGAAIDRFGPRRIAGVTAPLLLVTLAGMSFVQTPFGLTLCFTLMRLIGPECLQLVAKATYQRWFIRLRGAAGAIVGLSGIVLFMLPAIFTSLIDAVGWRHAYVVLAGLLPLLVLTGTAIIRDNPESVGLLPDGAVQDTANMHELKAAVIAASTPPPQPPLEVSSLREAVSHPMFWFFNLLDVGFAFFWSGLNFEFFSFLPTLGGELAKLSAERASRALFVPISVSQNLCKLLTSLCLVDRLSDRQRALACAALNLLAAACALCSPWLRTERSLFAWAVAYGLSSGARMALSEVIIASLFGTQALGRLMGANRCCSVFATGVGPLLFTLSKERAGGYSTAITVSAVGHGAVSVMALIAARRTLYMTSSQYEPVSTCGLRACNGNGESCGSRPTKA